MRGLDAAETSCLGSQSMATVLMCVSGVGGNARPTPALSRPALHLRPPGSPGAKALRTAGYCGGCWGSPRGGLGVWKPRILALEEGCRADTRQDEQQLLDVRGREGGRARTGCLNPGAHFHCASPRWVMLGSERIQH